MGSEEFSEVDQVFVCTTIVLGDDAAYNHDVDRILGRLNEGTAWNGRELCGNCEEKTTVREQISRSQNRLQSTVRVFIVETPCSSPHGSRNLLP